MGKHRYIADPNAVDPDTLLSDIPGVPPGIANQCSVYGIYTPQDIIDNGGIASLVEIGLCDDDIRIAHRVLRNGGIHID